MVEPVGLVMTVGDRQIHVRRRHASGPTVVLLAGAALSMEFWGDLLPRLDGFDVVSYDRPGMGGTDWPGRAPTLDDEVETGLGLLEALGVPVVLVAHSMAAFHAEAMTRRRPELVRGLVLVDPSVEWPTHEPRPIGGGVLHRLAARAAQALTGLGGAVVRIGTDLESTWSTGRVLDFIGGSRLTKVYADPRSLAMATAETLAYERQAWDLMAERSAHPWPGTPTVVLTASSGSDEYGPDQARLARLLGGTARVVEDSRHLMMLDRPDAIADAVRSLVPARLD